MLEKQTSPHPIPAPPSRIPRPWVGEPTLGLSKDSPSRGFPDHFRPPTPPSFPWLLGALQFHLPWVSPPSAPLRPRHPPLGTHPALGPPYGAVQLTVPSRPAAAPALAPLLLEANLPRAVQGDGLACLLLPHRPLPTCQAGQSLRPQGHLCGWGSGHTRCLWGLTCA